MGQPTRWHPPNLIDVVLHYNWDYIQLADNMVRIDGAKMLYDHRGVSINRLVMHEKVIEIEMRI